MIRTCMIGVSGFGRTHYQDLLREVEKKRMQAVGACIINQEEEVEACQTLRNLGCTLFTDYKEMLCNCEADLCMIPTGTPLHRPMSIAAVEAGMHVFVEKPVAATVQDAFAMQEAAESCGKFMAIGYQDMYPSHTMQVKRALLAGEIGTIQAIKGWAVWPRPDSYYQRNNWAGKLRIGDTWVLDSPYNNALAHEVMQMLFYAGATERTAATPVAVEAELYRANPIESADTCALRIHTQTGIPIYVFFTHAGEVNGPPHIEIRGDQGTIAWERSDSSKLIWADGSSREWPAETIRDSIYDALLARIAGEDTFICDVPLAIQQTKTMNAVHEASPIHTIPNKHCDRKPYKNSTKTVIHGIDRLMRRAFEEETLFSELGGVPWAQPARTFALNNYARFPQTDLPNQQCTPASS